MIGRVLGHYRVVEKLGAGGMGEVYRARDERLGRDVALKVLPEAFAQDRERLARFQREAHLLASLNHPHIAAIYGLEESDAKRFLVLELVEGETLAERVGRGPLPLEEALGLCRQIAEALEAAHERGIIHRDLKPANVKVTPAGTVKVLDFGLAKAFAGETPGATDLSKSPTVSDIASRAGVLLGTAAYMSPEQARGKPVDKRTDIWAFGCLLYELLTGQQAFPGPTVSDVIAGILEREPVWERLPEATPAKVRDLLHRCLQKDSNRRVHDIADARIEIEEALSAPARLAAPPAAATAAWRRAIPWGLAAVLVVTTAVALWSPWRSPAPTLRPSLRFSVVIPPTEPLALGISSGIAVSPDGSRIVYAGRRGETTQLYLRVLDQLETRPIAGTSGGAQPFFSPAGEWLGFFADGKLKKVRVTGGEPLALCAAANPRGASWGPDDTIVFAALPFGGLWRVSAAGGAPQAVTTPDQKKGEMSHRWPEVLPGGQAVLFVIWTGGSFDEARIAVQALRTGERQTLLEGGTYPRYATSGHLVFGRNGTLLAVPFDLARLAVKGSPVPLLEGVSMNPAGVSGVAHYAFSSDGVFAYLPGGEFAPDRSLVWVDRKGTAQPVGEAQGTFESPRLSPDGRHLAVGIRGKNDDVWLYELARGNLIRLTFDPGEDETPAWTPDGLRVTYASNRQGRRNLLWRPADGSAPEEPLLVADHHQHVTDWSPDGRVLLFADIDPVTEWDLWTLQLEGQPGVSGQPQPLLRTPTTEDWPRFSPDGRWLAYISNESGRPEIYVQAFPGAGGKWQVSTEGGTEPVWARHGRELFYRNADRMMAVSIATQPMFRAEKPRLLFEGRFERGTGGRQNYDVAPDGQRFVMIQAGEQESASTQLHVLLNWFDELKRRVPPDGK